MHFFLNLFLEQNYFGKTGKGPQIGEALKWKSDGAEIGCNTHAGTTNTKKNPFFTLLIAEIIKSIEDLGDTKQLGESF